MNLSDLLAKSSAAPQALAPEELAFLLALSRPDDLARLYEAAYALKLKCCGRGVSVRGLVEAGNVCAKDCLYCGIRKSNACVKRYTLSADEIVAAAEAARAMGYAALVIQSGEIEAAAHTEFIEDVLHRIAHLQLGVTLSLGEQTEEVYARWRAAGATRYLLRIETSNPALYAKIHPATCSWSRRVECLRALRRTGYQVGTGVLCALPGQTYADLAHDIAFYGEMDVDMIGMGPFIPAPNTPMGEMRAAGILTNAERLTLGLKMIAVTRLYLHDVNIAAATALQALADDGREQGIRAGANVLMPNVTDVAYRRSYQLYANKPCLDENAELCRADLDRRLAALGEELLYNQQGDSRHFAKRCGMRSCVPAQAMNNE